ncbi:MAG TPA: response regulator [Anaerolineae bacterium]|nr:response regulator [Anaerolineae bacterium]
MKRVLIVDDEINITMIIREGLRVLEDCEVLVATDEQMALAEIEAGCIDVLVTDYRMPGQNGLKLIAQAKERYPNLQAMIVTAYSDGTLHEEAKALGVAHVLTKPMRLDRFRQLVQELLTITTV